MLEVMIRLLKKSAGTSSKGVTFEPGTTDQEFLDNLQMAATTAAAWGEERLMA